MMGGGEVVRGVVGWTWFCERGGGLGGLGGFSHGGGVGIGWE